MDTLLNAFTSADYASQPLNMMALLLGLGLSFLSGQTIAWTYMTTHAGLSYSRAFVNSLVVIPMIVTVVLMVLNNNLVTAFGLMAVFAVVRFRNVLRDTLDATYILASITVGMACGTRKFSTAVLATLVFAALMLYLHWARFGARHRYDLILNLHWARPMGDLPDLAGLLDRHARRTQLASQRSNTGYDGSDLSYRLLLRDTGRMDELVTELRSFPGVSRVTSLKAEDESEV